MTRIIALLLLAVALVACGGEPGSNIGTAPNVIGYPLPDAKTTLEQAGVRYLVENDGGMFGIIVESNWTVCDEALLDSGAIRITVKKRGCG